MIEQIRVTVANTWRLRTAKDGVATVALDLTGYRDRLNELKADPAGHPFVLPWPPYPSTLWKWTFGGRYDNIASRDLVAALLPMWREQDIWSVLPGTARAPTLETYWHPFAVTAMVHTQLTDTHLPDAKAAGTALDELLRSKVDAVGSRLRDGAPLEQLPLPDKDADRQPIDYQPSGTFCVLSGLHRNAKDPLALATQLATLFQGANAPGVPLQSKDAAMAVKGANVGLVFSRDQIRAGRRIKCMHHNTAAMLAMLQNLATLFAGPGTIAWEAYPKLAAPVLNGLYRRVPPPGATSVYKSRVAELWLKQINAVDAVNRTNASLPNPPPSIVP